MASAICSSPRVHLKTTHTETTSCGNHGNMSGLTSLTNTHAHTRHMQADRQRYRKKGWQESGPISGQLDEEEKSGQKWRGHPAGLPQDERRRLESWPRWTWTPRLESWPRWTWTPRLESWDRGGRGRHVHRGQGDIQQDFHKTSDDVSSLAAVDVDATSRVLPRWTWTPRLAVSGFASRSPDRLDRSVLQRYRKYLAT